MTLAPHGKHLVAGYGIGSANTFGATMLGKLPVMDGIGYGQVDPSPGPWSVRCGPVTLTFRSPT